MSQRYRLYKRGWGVYYAFDNLTRNSESLETRNKQEAAKLHAKNEAHAQPMLNLQMARAYLSATDPAAASRTWEDVYAEKLKRVHGPTRDRWLTARKDPALQPLRFKRHISPRRFSIGHADKPDTTLYRKISRSNLHQLPTQTLQ